MPVISIHAADIPSCILGLQTGNGDSGDPQMIVFFASPRFDLNALNKGLAEAFPRSAVIGCSTAGEIASGVMADGSIVAMAIPPTIASKIAVTVIEDLSLPAGASNALTDLGQQFGSPVSSLDPDKHVGIILVDGLSGSEERVMERLGDLCDVPFVGGSAGDDMQFSSTKVCAGGRVFERAAVLAVLEVPAGYKILKTQSFRSTGKTLTATAVCEEERTVRSFDGQSAATSYAAAIGVDAKDLEGAFLRHPLGLMIDGQPWVRSPRAVLGGGNISFYCNVKEGMQVEVLEGTDIVAETRNDLAAALENGRTAGILNFNCILRAIELKAKGQAGDYGELFRTIPTVGFNTYGEEYTGHLNQTATMLLFQHA